MVKKLFIFNYLCKFIKYIKSIFSTRDIHISLVHIMPVATDTTARTTLSVALPAGDRYDSASLGLRELSPSDWPYLYRKRDIVYQHCSLLHIGIDAPGVSVKPSIALFHHGILLLAPLWTCNFISAIDNINAEPAININVVRLMLFRCIIRFLCTVGKATY